MKHSDDVLEIYFQKISRINKSNLIKKASKISELFDLISSGAVTLNKALADNNIALKDYIFGLSEQGKSVDDIAKHMKDAKLSVDFISEVIDIRKITKEAAVLKEALTSSYKKYSSVINSFGKGNSGQLSDDLIVETYKSLSTENKAQTIPPILKRLEELKTDLISLQGNSLSSDVRSISETISTSSSIPRIYADYESRLLKEIQKRGITLNPDGSFVKSTPTSTPDVKPNPTPAAPAASKPATTPKAAPSPVQKTIEDDFDLSPQPDIVAPKTPGSKTRKKVPKPAPEQTVESPKPTPEPVKTEPPKVEPPKAEAPKAEIPKTAPPKAEAPKATTPEAEAPKAEVPKATTPEVEVSKTTPTPDISESKSPGEVLGKTVAKLDAIERETTEPALKESVSKAKKAVTAQADNLPSKDKSEYDTYLAREKAKIDAQKLYQGKNLKESFKETINEFVVSSFKTGLIFTAGAAISGIFVALGLGWNVIKLAAVATGCYYLYKYITAEDPQLIGSDISEEILKSQIELVYSMLSNYTVKDGSANVGIFNKTIESLQLAYHSKLYDTAESEAEFNRALEVLDQLSENLFGLLSIPEFANDLVDATGYEDTAEEGKKLYYIIKNIKSLFIKAREKYPDKVFPGKNDITEPIGKAAPQDTTNTPGQVVKVLNEDIDISKMSPQFRSAAPRLAEKVLNSREGKIFLDPDNIWGGWLQKQTTTNSEGVLVRDFKKEYLEALKFLYLNKIFSRHDLAKFFRNNLSRVSRKNHSGFKNALKHYS